MKNRSTRLVLPLLGLALLGAAACDRGAESGAARSAAAQEDATNVVTVTARDFVFDAPDEIPAGLTTFRLVNEGPDLHHVWLVKLEEGRTVADIPAAMMAMEEGHAPPGWLISRGGPNTPVPGGVAEATLVLEPGDYALTCLIPAPDGEAHIAKGMLRPIRVTGAAANAAALPETDVVMTLRDYDYDLSAPIAAGESTIRIENAGPQEHEVLLMMIEPGKNLGDVLAWLQGGMQGPPPGAPMGGITGILPGDANNIHVDLPAGEYALLCFVPDSGDGRIHIEHGMAKQISVG